MQQPNILIGAISGNYSTSSIKNWVETSGWDDTRRFLLYYNASRDMELVNYLRTHKVVLIDPDFNYRGEKQLKWVTDTGANTLEHSYSLIHNSRFLHIYSLLQAFDHCDKVLVTDVRDVKFTRNPFEEIPSRGIITASEMITYSEESWNYNHLMQNLGLLGAFLQDQEVLNVGVFGGDVKTVSELSRDIYLMSIGKPLVADQTSFNYLIRTSYASKTTIKSIADKFAIHLHVVKAGLVPFDLTTLPEYAIIHQYDRFE
jgi:hypothetical protein